MLHQTLLLFFQFNPSSSSSSSSSSSTLVPSSFSYSSLSQVEAEMECVAAKNAFKTSFWPEITAKSNQPTVFEDFYGGNASNCGVSVDEFLVDEFLDFSKEEQQQDQEEEEEEEEEEKDCASVSSQEQNSNSSGPSVKDDFGFVSGSEFTVPTEEMEDLEWLSHFVDDSFSEFALPYLGRDSPDKTPVPNSNRPEPETRTTSPAQPLTFPTPFPARTRTRTKRPRTGGRVWSTGTPAITETSSCSSSCSSSSTSTSCLIFTNTGPNLDFLAHVGKLPEKKKKIPATKISVTQPQRRCSHCGVQKTPQWRAGPLGAKTLCNACGVRFKSGRLLPEYRPACSPTFSSDVHSNSHRKVLEMRLKKEMDPVESELAPAVQSF